MHADVCIHNNNNARLILQCRYRRGRAEHHRRNTGKNFLSESCVVMRVRQGWLKTSVCTLVFNNCTNVILKSLCK